jgi:hypothetical protein
MLRTVATLAPDQVIQCPRCRQDFTSSNTPAGRQPPLQRHSRIVPLALTGVTLLVVVAAVAALAAFIWPGFLRTAPRIDDPMALLPGDSNWIIGADVDRLRTRGVLEPVLGLLVSPPPMVPIAPLAAGVAELVRDSERLLVAGAAGDATSRSTLVLVMREPVNTEQVRRQCHAGASRRIHGHLVYRADPDKSGATAWLAFPGDRLIVLSNLEQAAFATLLVNAIAAERPAHPVAELLQETGGAPFWAVAHFDEHMKGKLKDALPAELAAAHASIGHGAILSVTLPDDPPALQARLSVLCAGGDANVLTVNLAVQRYWQKLKKEMAAAQLALMVFNPPLGSLLSDLGRSVHIRTQDARVVVTGEVTEKTLRRLKEMKK